MSQGLMGFDDKSLSEALDGWMDIRGRDFV